MQFFWHFVVNEQRIDKVQALCIAAAAILIAIVPASPWTPAPIYVPPREPSSAVSGVAATPLVELTNADRQANQLHPLAINASLQTVAQMKADDMAGKGYFAHVSPDGHSPWYWFQKVGYDYTFAGENLAVDFTDSIDVEKAWMNSTMHRGNILNSHFTEIGIATASGIYQGRVTTFVVEEFASPAIEPTALPPAPAPAKSSDSANRGAAPREISDEAQSAAAPLAPKIDFLSAWRLPPPIQSAWYGMIAAFALALAFMIGIKSQRQRVMRIAYGFALLVLVGSAVYAGHVYLFSKLPIA